MVRWMRAFVVGIRDGTSVVVAAVFACSLASSLPEMGFQPQLGSHDTDFDLPMGKVVAWFYATSPKITPFNFSLPSVQQTNILVTSPKYWLQSQYASGEHVWNENSLSVLQCKFVGLNHLVRRISPITATRGRVQLDVVCQKTAMDMLLVVTQVSVLFPPNIFHWEAPEYPADCRTSHTFKE